MKGKVFAAFRRTYMVAGAAGVSLDSLVAESVPSGRRQVELAGVARG